MARQGKADMTAQVECDETRTDAVMPQQARMLSSETWPRSSLNEELGDVTSLNPVYEPGMRESMKATLQQIKAVLIPFMSRA